MRREAIFGFIKKFQSSISQDHHFEMALNNEQPAAAGVHLRAMIYVADIHRVCFMMQLKRYK